MRMETWRRGLLIGGSGLLLTFTLSGCGGAGTVKSADGRDVIVGNQNAGDVTVKSEAGEIKINSNEKDGTFEYKGTDAQGGDFSIESGTSELPEDFPKEIPIPDGAKIETTMKTSTAEGTGYIVNYSVNEDSKVIGDLYREAFKKLGFEISEFSDQTSVSLLGNNDTHSFLLGITPIEEDKKVTSVTITYGTK